MPVGAAVFFVCAELCNSAFSQSTEEANETYETVVDIFFQKTRRIESSVALERLDTL